MLTVHSQLRCFDPLSGLLYRPVFTLFVIPTTSRLVDTRNPPACVQYLDAWFKEISRPGLYRASTGAICGPYTSILLRLTLAQDWHVPFPSCKQWSSSAPLHTATGAHACTQYVCANAKPCMALTEIGMQKACRSNCLQ